MSSSQPSLENRKDLWSFQCHTDSKKLKFCLVEDAILNLIAVSRMRKSLSYVFGLISAWTCKTKHLQRRQVPLVRSRNHLVRRRVRSIIFRNKNMLMIINWNNACHLLRFVHGKVSHFPTVTIK